MEYRLALARFAVQTESMVAEINLDADVYAYASSYASARGIPLGAAISQLLRQAEQSPHLQSSLITTRRGLLVKAMVGETVTPKMVKELSEDELG